jgi:hypothetical protein
MQDNKGKRIAVDDKYNGVDILTILLFHSNTVQNHGLKQLHIKSFTLNGNDIVNSACFANTF